MLTQMDITTDGFGYMLSFGDLVWVPFTYGIQARYLAFHPVDLGLPACAAIVALNVAGFYIFRTSNSDKDDFRKLDNPKSESSLCLFSIAILMLRLRIPPDRERDQVDDFWMVGKVQAPQLPW
jgi:hypothetical protein